MARSRRMALWRRAMEFSACRKGQALIEAAMALTSLLMALIAGVDVYLYAWERLGELA